jgi:elongation factor P
MCIRLNNEIYKVLLAEFKVGTAKLPSSMHTRLKNLHTGTLTDQRFHPEAKVDVISVETVTMEFSYADGDTLYFMHPVTFDQVEVPKRLVGRYAQFLDSGTKLKIDFLGEEPLDAHIPATVEVTVANTGAPMHSDINASPKFATLENGTEIQVPQFVKNGDRVRIEVESGKYVERIK